MRKKNIFAIYPVHKDLCKRWYISGWRVTEKKRVKAVRVWIPNLDTLEQRLAFAQIVISQLEAGTHPALAEKPVFTTIKGVQLIFSELQSLKLTLRKKTFMGYSSHFKRFNEYCTLKQCKELNAEVAQNFLNDLIEKGKSGVTVNQHRMTLRILCNRLVKKKKIKSNPFADTDRFRECKKGSTYFKTVQISQLKTYMLDKKPFLWHAIKYIYYGFIRPGELRQVKVGDVDFDNWIIKIRSNISKNKKQQFVAIPDALKKELSALALWQYPADYYLVGTEGLPSETPIAQNFLSRHHLHMLRELKYSADYNLYSWKHTGVVMAYKAGIGLKELQLQLRHHSLDMVKIYMESLGILDFDNIKNQFPAI